MEIEPTKEGTHVWGRGCYIPPKEFFYISVFVGI